MAEQREQLERIEQIEYLQDNQKQITRKLWEEIFDEDGPAFLDYYYEEKVKNNRILALKEDGKILSMLQLNPYELRIGAQGTCIHSEYVIAVATDATHRHQGMMRKLLHRSMTDLRREKMPFLYLMPADPAIYLPFGYRFVYEQRRDTYSVQFEGVSASKPALLFKPASTGDYAAIADYARNFIDQYLPDSITPVRDVEYYRILDKESKTEDGRLMYALQPDGSGKIIGCFSYTIEEQEVSIREPMIDPAYCSDFLNSLHQLWPECEKIHIFGTLQNDTFMCEDDQAVYHKDTLMAPTIMIRILDIPAFFSICRGTQEDTFKVKLQDDFLEENSGIYEIHVNADHSVQALKIKASSEDETDHAIGQDVPEISIENLTDALCGADGFHGIHIPGKFFINEFV